MKNNKRIVCAFIMLVMVFCLSMSAFAEANETGGEAAAVPSTVTAVTEKDAPADDEISYIQESSAPSAKKTNSNAPFFTGAVIAVFVFAGVAVFCKVKGNK